MDVFPKQTVASFQFWELKDVVVVQHISRLKPEIQHKIVTRVCPSKEYVHTHYTLHSISTGFKEFNNIQAKGTIKYNVCALSYLVILDETPVKKMSPIFCF